MIRALGKYWKLQKFSKIGSSPLSSHRLQVPHLLSTGYQLIFNYILKEYSDFFWSRLGYIITKIK